MNANIEAQLNAMLANRNAINEAINLRAGETLINADAGLIDAPSAILSIPTDSNTLYYKTDDTSAYEKLVPRGAQPMTQLISVGGMTRVDKSPNLLDFMTYNTYYIVAPPQWFNFVEVTIPAGTYRLTFDVILDGEWADGDGSDVYANYGSYVESEDSVTVHSGDVFTITEEKVFYFQASSYPNVTGKSYGMLISDAMLYAVPDESEEHIRTTFVPFYEHLVPTPVSEIVSEGKNLFDANNIIAGSFNSDGSFLTMPHLLRTEVPISIISGEKYTISCDSAYDLRFVYFYDVNEGYISNIWMNRPKNHYYTFTAPSEAAFVHIGFELDGMTSGNADVNAAKANSKVQLEFGSVATEYKPYSAEPIDTVAIPDAVKNDASWGYGVVDYNKKAYANIYDFNTKQYSKGVSDVIVLDGVTENRRFNNKNDRRCYFTLKNAQLEAPLATTNIALTISSTLKPVRWGSNDYECWIEGGSLIIILPSTIATVSDANAWLAEQYANGNPVRFQYALAEPIVTTIEDDSYEPPKFIRTEDGGTTTFENEAKEAVPSSVKYLIDLGEIV